MLVERISESQKMVTETSYSALMGLNSYPVRGLKKASEKRCEEIQEEYPNFDRELKLASQNIGVQVKELSDLITDHPRPVL